MSTRTLPLLFINLGGEMLYILDQRLRAQNIPADKAKKGNSASLAAIRITTQMSPCSAMNEPSARSVCLFTL